jgi:beta-galactosidase
MNRRRFLKTSSLSAAAGAVTRKPAILMALFVPGESSTGRTVYPLNTGWRWSAKKIVDATQRGFDDHAFIPVVLPHCVAPVAWHSVDPKTFQIESTYIRRFPMPASHKDARVFVDFDGAMTASTVFLNGTRLGEYKGGFTPFSFELTALIDWSAENVLCVQLDSRELADVPPFGDELDYLTYGGIYREVQLRVTAPTHIETVRAWGTRLDSETPCLEGEISLNRSRFPGAGDPDAIEVHLLDGEKVVGKVSRKLYPHENTIHLRLDPTERVRRWELHDPALYSVRVRLLRGVSVSDEVVQRFGFRSAVFTPTGFRLNGKPVKLRGLNRHQSFPYAGMALPARVQRKDAEILKQQLKCNVVRCSHYPPSRHFLDACDELGLLVIDEDPGWQHVGDSTEWQEHYIDNVRRMIERDRHHPSIVLWSIRINESHDMHDLYTRANELAHRLDPTRQTTGVRNFAESELLEDVFSVNDFKFPLRQPNHPLYLNTEFVGGEFPVRVGDDNARHREHILRYARIFNQINSDPRYAGGLGWCAFDYQTHRDFGSGDHICYHGVMDTFRNPKPASGFFRSQCPPDEEAVLEFGFHFAENDEPGDFLEAPICSNCDEIKCYILHADGAEFAVQMRPSKEMFPFLDHPPFFLTLPKGNDDWGDLRFDGYVGGKIVISKSLSGEGIDQRFELLLDDTTLVADGSDMSRVTARVSDQYGATRPLCSDPVEFLVEGPATLVGSSLASLSGGATSVWVRATGMAGEITVTARHLTFGERRAAVRSVGSEAQVFR